MIKEIKGNLLDVQQGIIAHQVNCKGVMGAGVAREIRKRVLSGEQYGHYQDMCRKGVRTWDLKEAIEEGYGDAVSFEDDGFTSFDAFMRSAGGRYYIGNTFFMH